MPSLLLAWMRYRSNSRVDGGMFVGLRPVIQILCHVLARGWRRWLRYFTEAKAEVKCRASARIRRPKHDTRFEWPASILIMTRYPFLPFKTHKTSAKNPRLLTIAGTIWFCRYRQCTPSQLWMHAPVAKERRLMTSQYPISDRTDNLSKSTCFFGLELPGTVSTISSELCIPLW